MSERAQPTMTPLSSFSFFSRLPREIRYMIWKLALPGPRIVYLKKHRLGSFHCHRVWSNTSNRNKINRFFFREDEFGTESPARGPYGCIGFKSSQPSIPLLHVCRESFDVTSGIYTRAFGTRGAFPETWFDFKRDTLLIDWGGYTIHDDPALFSRSYDSSDMSSDIRNVRNLVLRHGLIQPVTWQVNQYWLVRLIVDFKKLQNLTFVSELGFDKTDGEGLCLVDLDLSNRLRRVQKPYSPPWDSAQDKVDQILLKRWVEDTALRVKSLERFPLSGICIIPKIERKSITTRDMIHDLDEDEGRYQLEKELWGKREEDELK